MTAGVREVMGVGVGVREVVQGVVEARVVGGGVGQEGVAKD